LAQYFKISFCAREILTKNANIIGNILSHNKCTWSARSVWNSENRSAFFKIFIFKIKFFKKAILQQEEFYKVI